MFNFDPSNESGDLLPDGDYDATVINLEAKTSKSGNAMLVATLDVYGADGNSRTVQDYLLDTREAAWKLKRFCVAIGHDYKSGALDEAEVSRQQPNIVVRIFTEEGKGDFEPRNRVRAYKPKLTPTANSGGVGASAEAVKPAGADAATDDGLPF